MVKRMVRGKVILLTVLGILVMTSYAECAEWWNEDYQYRMKLTFDNSDSSEDLANFPVLVHLTSTHSNFWSHINNGITISDTKDLRFIDADNSNELHFEVERIDYSGQDALIWVKVPQINSGSTTDNIYVYYGNTSATQTSYHNAEEVWDTNFKMVQHLNETERTDGADNDHIDSTSYSNDGEAIITPESNMDATGEIDGADEFDGDNDYVNCGNAASLTIIDEVTIETWVKRDGVGYEGIVCRCCQYPFCLCSQSANQLATRYQLTDDNNEFIISDLIIPTDEWCYLAITHKYSTGEAHFYLNSSHEEKTATHTGTPKHAGTLTIGVLSNYSPTVRNFDGIIDEVRVSGVVRSGDWIEASYLNQKEGSTYVGYGEEENTYAPSASISLRPYSPVKEGNVDLTLTTSGDVTSTLSLYYTPKDKSRIEVGLSGSGSTWHGRLSITQSTGDGLASFSYRGEDQYGYVGRAITQGGTFRIDTKPPTATITLSQEEPVGIGKLTVTCTLNEGVHYSPDLRYIPQNKSPTKINLIGNENVWTGEITITNTTGDGEARFIFSVTDRAGNIGTTIISGETFIVKTIVKKGEIEERIVADIDDPKTKIIIPTGALKEDLRMYLTKKEDVPLFTGREPLLAYEFKAKDEDYQQIKDLTFKKRVKIVLHYKSLVKSEDENKLSIYYYDGFLWQRIPSKVDKLSSTVTGFIDHCTLFALFISEEPVKVKCGGATPNPFTPNGDGINDTTKFNIDLAQDMEIEEINVYDVKGRLVRTIEDELISWDGKDQFNDKCAGGVYIFQVKTEEGIASGTVTLIR